MTDGKNLGNIIDLVMDCHAGVVCGFIVPGEKRFFNFFKCEQLFVPWQNICKIGEDVILVEMFDANTCSINSVKKLGIENEDRPHKNYDNLSKNSKNSMEYYDNYEIFAKKTITPESYRSV